MRRIVLLCMPLLLVVAACGDDDEDATTETRVTTDVEETPSTTGPTSDQLPTDPCDAAFAEAAAAGGSEDDVEAFFPAARDCSDLADWLAASEAHPDAVTGTDPAVFAQNVCEAGIDISATPLCQEVLEDL